MRTTFASKTIALAAALFLLAQLASAAVLFVDGKNPAAKDDNPGTEAAPFKTIQAAVNKIQAGDTVSVKAGVYHEAVNFRGKNGTRSGARPTYWDRENTQYITLEAFGDDKVVLDGTLEIKDFKLAPGKKNLYVAPFVFKGWNKALTIVFAGEEQFMPFQARNPRATIDQPDLPLLPAVPTDDVQDRGWYYDKEKDLVYVNLAGKVPGKDLPIRVAELETGVDAASCFFPRIRKLEIHGYNQQGVVIYNTMGAVVEDNYIHHVNAGMWGGPSTDITLRRNTITNVGNVGLGIGQNLGGTVESNIIRDFHVNPFKTNQYAGGIMCNGIVGTAVRFNVVTHAIVGCAGLWPDCSGMGNGYYANTMYRIDNNGFYIEAGQAGNLLRWNNCYENWGGITLRQNYMNSVCENYLHDNHGVGMALSTPNADNTFGNHFGDNWIINNRVGLGTGASANKTLANAFDRNTYVVPKGGLVMQYDDKQFKTIEEVRAALGAEINGKQLDKFDPATLGLVSFRVFGTEKEWEPVQMFGNPGMERWDVTQDAQHEAGPFFWHHGTFRESIAMGWHGAGISDNGCPSTLPDTDGFLRFLDPRNYTFVKNYPGGKLGGGNIEEAKAHGGNYLVQVGAIPGKKMLDRGLGFWSPSLPTVPGAKVNVSMWIERSGIEPTDKDKLGGVYVFVEWTNITGQSATRSYIVGGEKPDQVQQAALAVGTAPYTNVKATVTAPPSAVWMQVAFGMKSASGWASFDDVDLQTQPGEHVAVAAAALPVDAAKFDWKSVDLSGVANRALVDDKADDGQGGWTDQGPQADMRNLPTGDQTFKGVRYTILPAEKPACVVLKSPARPQSDKLPESVDIPVNAKAGLISFLHSSAWLMADVENWRYVIQYADGKEEVVKIVGRKHVADWADANFRDSDFNQDPATGWTRTAVTVNTSRFPNVNVYATIWKNPRPDAEIKTIKMVSAKAGVPVLVAVSLGTTKK